VHPRRQISDDFRLGLQIDSAHISLKMNVAEIEVLIIFRASLFYLKGLITESLNNDLNFPSLSLFTPKSKYPIREAERICIIFADLYSIVLIGHCF
jgi:hypothetical protein